MFKNLTINISLANALLEMPSYAKFMKDLVTKKRSLEFETIKVSYHYSSVMTSNIVAKKEDPSAFTIPRTIGVY